ncbi:hypothetical protein [Dermatobacter hominis]|uniref:hypothetical protein n=1 Tax=Dermatobacter hominis TaxID=2884263 RepID=UPI001D115B13|nr:hypothetical protein [Dermatobacter hominis]UDY37917.1 hypothetical protein LH044_10315 [Dermatobacter hominis]
MKVQWEMAERVQVDVAERTAEHERTGAGDWTHPAVLEGDELVRVRSEELARRARRRHRGATSRREPWVAGGVGTLVFLAAGAVVALASRAVPGDATSRVVAAQSVLFGRDPHPEAIGFVWGPFPTLFEVPVVWLRDWWPGFAGSGMAAVVVSAAFMGATLAQIVGWGQDCRATRPSRWAVAVATAASPLVLLYGANGMSEACWLFFLVVAARQLARWLDDDGLVPLSLCGLALALAYLTRYETVAAVIAVAVVVVVASLRRSAGHAVGGAPASTDRDPLELWEERRGRAVLDVAVVVLPAATAFGFWALASWAVIGEPFAQFSSDYGNSAIVAAAGDSLGGIVGDLSPAGRTWFTVRQVLVVAPLLLPLVALAVWIGDRAAARTTAAVAVLGAPVAAQVVLSASGTTFPWFRYVIGAVVLSSLVALVICGEWSWTRRRRTLAALVVLALVPGIVLSWQTVVTGSYGATDDEATLDAVRATLSGHDGDPTAQRRADDVGARGRGPSRRRTRRGADGRVVDVRRRRRVGATRAVRDPVGPGLRGGGQRSRHLRHPLRPGPPARRRR